MIDLSKGIDEYYKIKLVDKTILKLKKPTQAMLITMGELSKNDLEEMEMLQGLYDLLLRIFNRNLNERTFTVDDIEDMIPFELAFEVLEDYFKSSFLKLKES